jgi:hypothetical protein
MNPGFSERTFEFCFNAEFCQLFGGLLASHPHIPSQRMEKDLGYDVEFQLTHNQFTSSIFLQHKTSYFAEHRAGRNGAFFDHHGGPYFRFTVDNDQHNTLHELSLTKGNAYYCAPCFSRSHELQTHFRGFTIASHAILLDPIDVGEIADVARHNITYAPNGAEPTLHSEPKRFKKAYSGDREGAPHFRRRRIDKEYVNQLSEEIISRTVNSKFHKAVTHAVRDLPPIEQAQYLLGKVYDVTWILLPANNAQPNLVGNA